MSDPRDDPTVSDDDDLLRRVPQSPSFVVRDEASGTERPATGSFRFDKDGLSVYLLSALTNLGNPCRTVADSILERPGRCIMLPVRTCRAQGMAVIHDPVNQSTLGLAHALLLRPDDVGIRRLQKQLSDIARFCA